MTTTPLELFLSDEVQSLLDHFAAVLDIRVTFFSADGTHLRRGKEMCNSTFCRIIQQEPGGLDRCLEIDRIKRQEAVAKRDILLYRCHAGLHEGVAPIYVHDKLAGFLMVGQFRTGDELPECCNAPRLSKEERQELTEAFLALPKFTPEKLNGILGLFKTLIDYIAVRELAVLQSDRLKMEIDNYIERHGNESIRLPEMAKKLGRSVSTISQFLRRNYQTNFKELLIEHRLEKAECFWKEHPDATVAEAAYAAGFSDQFYFSRVFRLRRGFPPGEFRDRLRGRHAATE